MSTPGVDEPWIDTSDQETQIIEPQLGVVESKPDGSLVGELLKRRSELAGERHYDIEVAGWNGCVVLRCGPVRGSVIQRLRERAEQSQSPDRDLNVNCDTLIAACKEVLVRRSRGEELEQADPDWGPVRLDEHCGELFQLGTAKAREVVKGLYQNANAPDIAIGAAAGAYVQWAASAEGELDEEFLGEA